jgi:hypothetical protein
MSEMTPEEFWGILQAQVAEVSKPEFRLYYDDEGFPLFYSMEQMPGNYIVVDSDTYLNGPKHIRVIDGKIVIYKTVFAKKIAPSTQGQPCDTRDVCVIVDENQTHTKWQLKKMEYTT